MVNWKEQEVLILGGTGTLGKMLTKLLVAKGVHGIRVFSRGELEQAKMRRLFGPKAPIAYMIGDVKDYDRLRLAMRRATMVINAAAMKHVDICEYNPLEAVNTNVEGARNVIMAALDEQVPRVMHVSTDKAVYPVNLYGATKAVTERLFVHANIYSAARSPMFSCVRYGNVLGSRGSVLQTFQDQYNEDGKVKLTDINMTRFWTTVRNAAQFILDRFEDMEGGEIFVPYLKSCPVQVLAEAVTKKDVEVEEIGMRPGEKLHECMITEEESKYTWLMGNVGQDDKTWYVVKSPLFSHHNPDPVTPWRWDSNDHEQNHKMLLSSEDIKKMLNQAYGDGL